MFFERLALAAFFLAATAAAHAELHWDKPLQEFKLTPDSKEVQARFVFHNSGSTPVTVKSVKTSCGCTTARLEKKLYQPGEQGEVLATYAFHGQSGYLRKLVTVVTDDQPDKPTILDLRVYVHEPFDLKPQLVYWRTGDAVEGKTVQLTARDGYPVHIKSVTSTTPRFTAALATNKPGEDYSVMITPADTAARDTGEINVLTDYPADAPRTYTIHARIK